MAYSLGSERPFAAAISLNPVWAMRAWIVERRARHARRSALMGLLDMDAALLDDLGIDRQDVIDALSHPKVNIGTALAARRTRASDDWLSAR